MKKEKKKQHRASSQLTKWFTPSYDVNFCCIVLMSEFSIMAAGCSFAWWHSANNDRQRGHNDDDNNNLLKKDEYKTHYHPLPLNAPPEKLLILFKSNTWSDVWLVVPSHVITARFFCRVVWRLIIIAIALNNKKNTRVCVCFHFRGRIHSTNWWLLWRRCCWIQSSI